MMSWKVASLTLSLVLTTVRSEPPSTQYGAPLAPPISSYGTPNYNVNGNGHGHDHDHEEPKAYEFGYQVKDDYTGNNYNRQEASDGNQVRGEYRVQLPDGRTQIVTYWADWQTGFHADVRYEGTASYPEQYNTGNQYNAYQAPSNQYGAPGFGGAGQGAYSNNYQSANQYSGGGYNAPAATSSVAIKDYSNGGNNYNTGGNYNSFGGQQYDSYSSGGFGSKLGPTPVYGAP